jgi:hypothetical protein
VNVPAVSATLRGAVCAALVNELVSSGVLTDPHVNSAQVVEVLLPALDPIFGRLAALERTIKAPEAIREIHWGIRYTFPDGGSFVSDYRTLESSARSDLLAPPLGGGTQTLVAREVTRKEWTEVT